MYQDAVRVVADGGGVDSSQTLFGAIILGITGVLVAWIGRPRRQDRPAPPAPPADPTRDEQEVDALKRNQAKLVAALIEARDLLAKSGQPVPPWPELEPT